MMELDGQRVCVVGGTAGIGLAIARRVHVLGAAVIVAGRDADKAANAASDIGERASGGALDITDEQSIAAFFAEIGEIDHLVVTAAQVRGGAFLGGNVDAARASFEGKFWAQYLCAQHAQVSRSILLTAGTLSRRALPGTAALAAVNGAVESLGRALAVELAPVRVNVLSPGLVRGTEAYNDMPSEAREGMFAGAAARLPAGLVGDPDSVAGPAVALLVSPYATGTVLDIDGGGLIS